jgi:formyl-CoA transferase
MSEVAMENSAQGPLAGLRVIELGSIVAASFAARTLGDLGAEVIKIEAPGNLDPLREWGQGTVQGRSLWWMVQSRNKKLVTLDLHRGEGQELFRSLCARSDVVVENFRPGTLEKWGLGYDSLASVNAAVILARISGFGQTGPYRHRPGFAAVAEAMGGMRYINGFADGPPLRMGLSIGDTIAGLYAVQGILAALHERKCSGKGQEIDVALTESCLAMMEGSIAEYDSLGKVRGRTGTRIPGVVPSNVFKTQDGKWLVIAASQARMFERLCGLIGLPELNRDERFATQEARCANQEALEAIIAEWVSRHPAKKLEAILDDAAIAAGPVHSVADMLADPQFKARNAFVTHHDEVAGDFLAQGVTPRFSRTPGAVRWSGPWQAGLHNQEIYGDLLGLSKSEQEALRRNGTI